MLKIFGPIEHLALAGCPGFQLSQSVTYTEVGF